MFYVKIITIPRHTNVANKKEKVFFIMRYKTLTFDNQTSSLNGDTVFIWRFKYYFVSSVTALDEIYIGPWFEGPALFSINQKRRLLILFNKC